METTVEILKGQDLKNYIEETLNQIDVYIEKNNYRRNLDLISLIVSIKKINDFSWTRTKHVNRKLRFLNKKMSIRRINSTMNWLFKKILQEKDSLIVKVSLKEELIQKKRKEWKDYQKEANRLLEEYKKEKGDFYKK